MVNEAEYDPFLKRHADRLEDRLDNPGKATKRAVDRFTEAHDASSRGGLRAAAANLSQSGAGLSPLARRRMKRAQGEARSRGTAGIEIGREKDEDAMILGATGGLNAVADAGRQDRMAALADQRLRRSAWESARQIDLAERAQRLNNWMARMDAIEMLGGL